MARFRKDKEKEKKIALEHIDDLFYQAEKAFHTNPDLSRSYVQLARRIQMKFRLRMPKQHKRKFCKHCYTYLVPSVNSRVRLNNSKLTIYCHECKKFSRITLK